MTQLESYRNVVAFGAHPDDLEVGCGGLLARLVTSGARVTMVVASIPNRFEARLGEARAGAAAIGAQLHLLEDARASRLDDLPMHELVARCDHLVAKLAPDLVITQGARDQHWDHTLVHRATVSSVRRSRCDVLAYAASPALDPLGYPIGRCYADITPTIDTKLAAIAAHATQFTPAAVEGRRDIARAIGQLHGVRYAEAFEVVRLALR
jgi:LmbE family N-acetylglucosaminyl deacetylase